MSFTHTPFRAPAPPRRSTQNSHLGRCQMLQEEFEAFCIQDDLQRYSLQPADSGDARSAHSWGFQDGWYGVRYWHFKHCTPGSRTMCKKCRAKGGFKGHPYPPTCIPSAYWGYSAERDRLYKQPEFDLEHSHALHAELNAVPAPFMNLKATLAWARAREFPVPPRNQLPTVRWLAEQMAELEPVHLKEDRSFDADDKRSRMLIDQHNAWLLAKDAKSETLVHKATKKPVDSYYYSVELDDSVPM